ncbi:sn1-specific diacylglycerol lipase beta-like protein [Populus alba x Populus x berolinensis]|uniref:Sn1-specific diacylglycerol lipase beta-like protein n=1 Tax=Populus alba x Populus x berolinensis TaxID=444605 RepID=A0AAD6WDE3_9ROSI|nr:sn1-specific diacylglycerol lipase beta-like protein [Populus alba x Populus x berolinensis]
MTTLRIDTKIDYNHYVVGHSGIVEAARDLYIQIEGDLADNESENSSGLLSSLLGAGCECDGYSLHIVGHSL